MEIQITVDTQGDDSATHDLYYWLRQDRELRRYVEVELARASEASDRMSAGDIINMFVSNGIAAASLLVNVVVAWRAARPSQPGPVTLERGGMTVTVHDTTGDTLSRVAELLASAPHGGDPEATGAGQQSAPSGSGNG
ncbi:effector-associated constant component EACC1 [Streptomyces sp. O3]